MFTYDHLLLFFYLYMDFPIRFSCLSIIKKVEEKGIPFGLLLVKKGFQSGLVVDISYEDMFDICWFLEPLSSKVLFWHFHL